MPSQKVKQILGMFRTHFQAEAADIPVALRQESPDIVFNALLEEDENPMPAVMPMPGAMPTNGAQITPQGQDPAAMLESLLGAAQPQGDEAHHAPAPAGMGGGAAPPAPDGAPAPGPEEEMALPPGIDEMLGLS